MAVVNLDDAVPVWFDFEDGGRVQLRTADPDVMKAIRKQSTKRRVEYKRIEGRAERFEIEETDDDLQNALFWDHIIVAWENFFDAHGTPIPCTRENKVKLLTRVPRFTQFIADALKQLADDQERQEETAQKN